MNRLMRQLSAGLVITVQSEAISNDCVPPADEDDIDPVETRDQSFIAHILQLMTAVMRQDGFIVDQPACDFAHQLWFLLLNWTLRLEPHLMVHLLQCQSELVRYIGRQWPADRVARLVSVPWNHLALLHIIQSPLHSACRSECVQLVRQILLIGKSVDIRNSCSFPDRLGSASSLGIPY